MSNSVLLVVPDPNEPDNKQQTMDVIKCLVSSVLSHDNFDTLFVVVDRNDVVENIVNLVINIETICDFFEEKTCQPIGHDRIKSLTSVEDLNFGNLPTYCIVDNYIRKIIESDASNSFCYKEPTDIELVSYLKSHLELSDKYRKLIKKRILVIPYLINDEIFKKNIGHNDGFAFLHILSDCNLAFKRLIPFNESELIIIKENKLGYKGCYTPALKAIIKEKDTKKPIIYLEDAFKRMPNNESSCYDKENKKIIVNLQGIKWKEELLKITHYYLRGDSIYLSYGNEGGAYDYCVKIKNHIESELPFVTVKIDKIPDNYMTSLSSYLSALKNGKIIIAIINERYLNSQNSMGEICGALKSKGFKKNRAVGNFDDLVYGIYPIVMSGCWDLISGQKKMTDIYCKWQEQLKTEEDNYNAIQSTKGRLLKEQVKKIKELKMICNMFEDVVIWLRDVFNFTSDEHEKREFKILINKVYERLYKDLNYPSIYGGKRS